MTDGNKPKRGRKKGASKTGGRTKGTRNRNSMTVLRALDHANLPIIEFLVKDIQCLEPDQRVTRWFQLMGYLYPRLKMTDPNPSIPSPPPGEIATPPASQPSREDRLKIIHGHVPSKPETSGK